MLEFHGRPFAEYLLDMLVAQGFERITFLLGYLPEVIQRYFEDGRRWGVHVEYAVSETDAQTSTRLRLARPLLDDYFLLLYCDNYWPLQVDRMWQQFSASGASAMLTVYSNKKGERKDNVRVSSDGHVEFYDRTRSEPGLKGVEIGYAIISSAVLDFLPEADCAFEDAVYPELIRQRELLAYLTDHCYYSVGSHERLPLTTIFLKRQPAIILDRDGVLNRRPSRGEYIRSIDQFEWLPGARQALRLLNEAGYVVIVISNQAGIARGALTTADLDKIHERMRREAAEAGGRIDGIYYCPHHWHDGCECRKPKPGMFFQAQHDFNLDLTRTLTVGDDERDIEASEAAGSAGVLVSPGFSLLDLVSNRVPAVRSRYT